MKRHSLADRILQCKNNNRDALERGAYRGNGFMLNIMTNELRRLEAVVGNSE